MNTLLFTGSAISYDKKPLICYEEIEISAKEVAFKSYPLSLIKATIDNDGITVDGIRYEWKMLPVTINKHGKHATVYRDIVDENITITIEFNSVNTEDKL